MTVNDVVFEDVVSALRKRFLDHDYDGQLCYLDFWVMLYIVGLNTGDLINFHDMPSFCHDYRLEVAPELGKMVWNYMQLSCTLLLPRGLQGGKSSIDQKADRQHRRRVGGLHDGTFHFSKTLQESLSTQELLGSDENDTIGLFIDGSAPATRQASSTTALDRFRPLSMQTEASYEDSSRQYGCEPVVVGVRPTGPTPKPIAPLRVSVMGNCDVLPKLDYKILPVRRRMKAGTQKDKSRFPAKSIIGSVPMKDDGNSGEGPAVNGDSVSQHEERAQTESFQTCQSILEPENTSLDQAEARKTFIEKRRNTTIAVVSTVETETSVTPTCSQPEVLKRPSSHKLMRAMSEQILPGKAEEQRERKAKLRRPSPVEIVASPREETPLGRAFDYDQTTGSASGDSGSEAEGNNVEQSSEGDERFAITEPSKPIVVLVNEALLEPMPVVEEEVSPEAIEPATWHVEEEAVKNVVESGAVIEGIQEQTVAADTPVNKEAILVPTLAALTPVEASGVELDATNKVSSHEEWPETSIGTPVVKGVNIYNHHEFRFSQQVSFRQSVAVSNNAYRTAMWNPNDDSDSDNDECIKTSTDNPEGSGNKDGLATGTINNSTHFEDVDEFAACDLNLRAKAALARRTTLSPSHLSRFDDSLQPQRSMKSNSQERQLIDDPQDEGEDDPESIVDTPLMLFRRERLNEEAERALYGEHLADILGEGIALSSEAEAAMQHKWRHFFDESESSIFATIRHDLEKKQMEQQEAEEQQTKLRKKWQEQRDHDLQRLQNSRQNNCLVMSTKQTNSTNSAVNPSFRLQRIHRESCHQYTEELQFGVSVQRELIEANTTLFFHFYYLPEGHGSIITLKMHVLRGDAEVFMSADTKAPCATDFMWRSSERLVKGGDEGQRIILYPRELLRVARAAAADAASTKQDPDLLDTDTSTALLQSNHPKRSQRVGLYLSVVALEPSTTFTLVVMCSGQKRQPSHAVQAVDSLIDRFNTISRSFQSQEVIPFTSPSKHRDTLSSKEVIESERFDQRSLFDRDSNILDDNEGSGDEEGSIGLAGMTRGRQETKKTIVDGVDPQELKSFQRLLDTLSDKRGVESSEATSILLAGPSEEHLEFIQDEDQRFQELQHLLSPSKSSLEDFHNHYDFISIASGRRHMRQGKRQRLRRVVTARLQQKLAPLRHPSTVRLDLGKSVSTGMLMNLRLARTASRPVALSMWTE